MRETASPRTGCGTHGRVFSSTATMQHTSSRLDKSSQSQRLPPGLQHTMCRAAPAKLMPQRLCQVETFCRQPQLVEPDIMWPGCIAKQKPTLWPGPSAVSYYDGGHVTKALAACASKHVFTSSEAARVHYRQTAHTSSLIGCTTEHRPFVGASQVQSYYHSISCQHPSRTPSMLCFHLVGNYGTVTSCKATCALLHMHYCQSALALCPPVTDQILATS